VSGTVSDAVKAIKDGLRQIDGLRVADFIPDSLNAPMAVINLEEATYHRAFGGGDVVLRFQVTVVVGRVAERVAQSRLDAYLSYDGAQSIRKAIESGPHLECGFETLQVERAGNLQPVTVQDVVYLAVDFTVTVHA
jgi:hypothetical protein